MRILVVEDEKTLCKTIAKGLRLDGYEVDTCFDGEAAWDIILSESYDLIILDLNLPGMDGMKVLQKIRMEDTETNILILSARGQLQDKIDGLDGGANDYLCKPFHFEELEARVRSLTRRCVVQNNLVLECGEISLDTKARTALARGNRAITYAKRTRPFGVSYAPSGASSKPGRAYTACVGWKRRQFQQFHPCAYFRASQEVESGLGI